jgi:hypothetical protein|eukprot:scaffold1593_cov193-Alexandrium_tamarense.AAC.30
MNTVHQNLSTSPSAPRIGSIVTEDEAMGMILEGLKDAYAREQTKEQFRSEGLSAAQRNQVLEAFPYVSDADRLPVLSEDDVSVLRFQTQNRGYDEMKQALRLVQDQLAEYHTVLEQNQLLEERNRILELQSTEKDARISYLERDAIQLKLNLAMAMSSVDHNALNLSRELANVKRQNADLIKTLSDVSLKSMPQQRTSSCSVTPKQQLSIQKCATSVSLRTVQDLTSNKRSHCGSHREQANPMDNRFGLVRRNLVKQAQPQGQPPIIPNDGIVGLVVEANMKTSDSYSLLPEEPYPQPLDVDLPIGVNFMNSTRSCFANQGKHAQAPLSNELRSDVSINVPSTKSFGTASTSVLSSSELGTIPSFPSAYNNNTSNAQFCSNAVVGNISNSSYGQKNGTWSEIQPMDTDNKLFRNFFRHC